MTPTPEQIRAWRKGEGLSQTKAAEMAGVKLRAWARWESGERSVPQWLRDVLVYRHGSGP